MAKYEYFRIVLALAMAALSASEVTAEDQQKSINREKSSFSSAATQNKASRAQVGVGMLEYSISVSMINYGSVDARLEQKYYFPSAVEVVTFSLQNEGYRAEKSATNERLTRSVGGDVYLAPSDIKTAEMKYINHVAQAYDEETKTFQKLFTTVAISEGDLVGGQISSPDFPLSYPNGADLKWLISYPDNNIVRFEMEDYATEQCCDRLTVYDGYNMSTNPLATYEGSYTLGGHNVVFSTQSAIFVWFTSDCVTTDRGFRASFINQPVDITPTMPCGNVQQLNDNEGYIQSPNYPEPYGEDMNCTWSVETPHDTTVSFILTNFTIGSDDVVDFYEGTPSNRGKRITTLTGIDYLGYYVIDATSNQAFATFTSGYSTDYGDKFYISYVGQTIETTTTELYTEAPTTIKPDLCPTNNHYSGDSGSFESPNFPDDYYNDLNCSTWVTTPSGTAIRLTVDTFSLNSGDYLYIYDADSGQHLKTYSVGYAYGYAWQAPTNNIQVVFVTDSSATFAGYSFFYTGTDEYATTAPPPKCGGPTPFNDGAITSTAFGYYPYYNNENCIWTIAVDSDRYILFTLQYFSTEECCDYVTILDGNPNNSSGTVETLRGYENKGYEILVSNDQAWMNFVSDEYDTANGFNITYRPVMTGYIPNDAGTGRSHIV